MARRTVDDDTRWLVVTRIPMLLERLAKGEISTGHLITHELSLDEGAKSYDLFKHQKDGCVRTVFDPTR